MKWKKRKEKNILDKIDKEKFINDIKRDLGIKEKKYYTKEKKNREYEVFKALPLEKKEQLFKKNAVTLLSLIDNLHAVEVMANESDYHSGIFYEKRYTREELEKEYGVDLRTYTYNPDNFPFKEDLE